MLTIHAFGSFTLFTTTIRDGNGFIAVNDLDLIERRVDGHGGWLFTYSL